MKLTKLEINQLLISTLLSNSLIITYEYNHHLQLPKYYGTSLNAETLDPKFLIIYILEIQNFNQI